MNVHCTKMVNLSTFMCIKCNELQLHPFLKLYLFFMHYELNFLYIYFIFYEHFERNKTKKTNKCQTVKLKVHFCSLEHALFCHIKIHFSCTFLFCYYLMYLCIESSLDKWFHTRESLSWLCAAAPTALMLINRFIFKKKLVQSIFRYKLMVLLSFTR